MCVTNRLFLCFVLYCRLHGVSIRLGAAYVYRTLNEYLKKGGITGVDSKELIDIIDGYNGKGYTLSLNEEMSKWNCYSCYF